MSFWLLATAVVYIGALAFLGYRSWRRIKTAEDYILGGSGFGVLVGMLTFAATLFSAFTFMGMPDFFRTHGVGAWIFLAVADAVLFFLLLWLGPKLRQRAAGLNYQGISGMLSELYGSGWAGYVFFAGAFCFLIPYVSIQIRGVAIFLNAMFPEALPAWSWSVVVVLIMLAYSEVGGLRAIVYCDVFQGIVLLVTIWIIAIGCLQQVGGVAGLFEKVTQTNRALLSVPGPEGLFSTQFLVASCLAFICTPVTQPQVLTRLIIVRSQKTMQLVAVGMGIFTFVILLATIVIGFYGAINYAGVSTRDFLAGIYLHEQMDVIAALVVVGLLAAATSTADSQIFALGSELRSILLRHGVSRLIYTRVAVLTFGFAALVFSIVSSDQLVLLARVSFAGTALMAPMVLAAIYRSRPPGVEIIAITGMSIVIFLLSLLGVLPAEFGGVRVDLLLLLTTSLFALLSSLFRRT